MKVGLGAGLRQVRSGAIGGSISGGEWMATSENTIITQTLIVVCDGDSAQDRFPLSNGC